MEIKARVSLYSLIFHEDVRGPSYLPIAVSLAFCFLGWHNVISLDRVPPSYELFHTCPAYTQMDKNRNYHNAKSIAYKGPHLPSLEDKTALRMPRPYFLASSSPFYAIQR